MAERVCVVMPTYNELENLHPTVGGIFACRPSVEILIVDDGSPDGTGEEADHMAAEDPRIHVLHRAGKNGLGPAYLAGFAWALERGFDVVCEMGHGRLAPASGSSEIIGSARGGGVVR